MKKFIFAILFSIVLLNVNAQHYETLYIEEMGHMGDFSIYCAENDDFLGVIVFGTSCSDQEWTLKDGLGNVLIHEENVDSLIISNPHEFVTYFLDYSSCDSTFNVFEFAIMFKLFPENPFIGPIVWKSLGDFVVLNAHDVGSWSTGETGELIEVSEQGTYSVTLTNDCGSVTYSVEVRDNVELYRATCDLVTNRNQLTWQVTEAQAQYVSAVKVYRNSTELVATVPYTDGTFTDNIGSEATQWQYHIVAVDTDGNDCPIPSRWKRTIHLDRVQGAQGNQILQWTPYEEESPTKETVEAYGIYDIVNGEARHVIDVGSFTNVYAYNPADFMGYGAVAAKFAENKGFETLAFSNHTIVPLDVEENKTSIFTVYPNPSDGRFTVEGTGHLTITNVLGQTVLESQVDGLQTFTLPQGVYFLRSDGYYPTVYKLIIE